MNEVNHRKTQEIYKRSCRVVTPRDLIALLTCKNHLLISSLLSIVMILLFSCQQQSQPNILSNDAKRETTNFELLSAISTGVDFINEVEDKEGFNILTYRNFYNGGGVAIGDVNNDGKPDIYFTANLGSNKLYLNKGGLKFEDVTDISGVKGSQGWSTGVTMADINADGWLDIYVSNSGDLSGDKKENELFINRGVTSSDGAPLFDNLASLYGLNNNGYSTQASFFDYDMDGDLDCYLLNNSFKEPDKIELFKSMRDQPDHLAGDKLYRNNLISKNGTSELTFTDVTEESGIYSSAIGFGLGASVGDVNNDMLPDIYVSNDFWERDYLYINSGDGTFSEELIDRINFCSISSMGGDMADINNDGYPEIISTDMLPADNYRLKAMSAFDPYHLEDMKYRANYHYQIGQNCLHLNDGDGAFQEVAMISGVGATDWSWGALLFDFENDGLKDLFVSNGIQKDLMYMDFRDFLSENNSKGPSSTESVLNTTELISKMPANPIANFAFSNIDGLRFKNVGADIGLGAMSFSNGAAYGDLDGDGDMDLVINNVNSPAWIYKNKAEQMQHHYINVRLKGDKYNTCGIGAKVEVVTKYGTQMLENYNSRGFQSSIEPHLTFGLRDAEVIDQLTVTWNNQVSQVLKKVEVDQVIELDYKNAVTQEKIPTLENPLFTEVSTSVLYGDTRHEENRHNDFDNEPLLLHMLSSEGPRMIKGDVNGDGKEDFIVLGARDDEDKLFVQQNQGGFKRKPVSHFDASRAFESTCGVLSDLDGDGDLDLIIGSGGNEIAQDKKYYILRHYNNDGQGNFKIDNRNIPQALGNFSCIIAEDIDADGDVDLFIGGRAVPGNYGLPPRSFLFYNEEGRWVDRSEEELAGVGMVTDAVWSDVDGDADKDLIVVGDWMGIKIFNNDDGRIKFSHEIPESKGLWNRIELSDLDNDGDDDYIIGNRGLNSKLRASTEKPMSMYVNDFDANGKSEFIIEAYGPLDDLAYPVASKMEITDQLPNLKKNILKYEDYASKTYESLFSEDVKQQSIAYQIDNLSTVVIWNNEAGLKLDPLPYSAQLSPAYGITTFDFNSDGIKDIWLGGNLYELKPQIGRHDASRGVLLLGDKNMKYSAISNKEAGIVVMGQVRDAMMMNSGDDALLMVARNNDSILAYKKNHQN